MKTLKIKCLLILSLFCAGLASAQTKTVLLENGSMANKLDIVFMGDGFSATDQTEFNNLVNAYFQNMFTYKNDALDDVLAELQSSYNVYRVNMNSTNSGVSKFVGSGASCPQTTVTKNTAFNFRYSGCWDNCWMSKSGDTDTRINNALAAVGLTGADFIVMILNESGFGGCSYGRVLSITKTTTNSVLFHELGHSVGGLADEYDRPGCFSGGDPAQRNVSTAQKSVKWDVFARSTTTTGNPAEYNVSEKGEFQGAKYKTTCIFRPSANSTMRGNTNLQNPPSYDEFWVRNQPNSGYDFDSVYVGNFGGSDYSDVVVHFGDYLAGYLVGTPKGFTGSGTATRVTSSYFTAKQIRGPGGTWNVDSLDRFVVGDFTGDGKDDLIAFFPNGSNSRFGMFESVQDSFKCVRIYYRNLPYWAMRSNDQYYLSDFDGDGKKDVLIYNTTNWSFGYLCMLKSTGNALSVKARYDRDIPGHRISRKDKIYVSDFSGDGKEDLVIFQTDTRTTRMFASNGTGLALSSQYVGSLPGYASKANDQYYIADFNGDGKDDLYVFNGKDWSSRYLLMLQSNGTGYSLVRRYQNTLPSRNLISNYREIGRDDWSVLLRDQNRNIDLAIDLHTKKVDIRPINQDPWEPRFNVTEAFPTAPTGAIPTQGTSVGIVEIPVNGRNVNLVDFGTNGTRAGTFRLINNTTWREEKPGSANITYTQTNRDDWSVYLRTGSGFGVVQVQIDLHTKKITYRDMAHPNGIVRFTVMRSSARMNGWTTNAATFADNAGKSLGRLINDGSGNWHETSLPNWQMNRNDQYYVADINGDGKDDLYVFNPTDWSTEWLGSIISSGSSLNLTSSERDKIGVYDLTADDRILVDNRRTGRDNLFIRRSDWFGYLWSVNSGLKLNSIYHKYIHTFKHHDKGWY